MTGSNETIFARATGAGRAGVSVYRLSGERAFDIARSLVGDLPAPRQTKLVNLNCPDTEQLIDRGLVIPFQGPASFTGEDIVEFHLHGALSVEAALYEALMGLGARPAEAGQFTKRALLAGKLDLAQVEALADLIDSETSVQRKQALGQLDGRLSALAEGWRRFLLGILAPLEADVDFPDEEGVPAAVAARAGPEIEGLIKELTDYKSQSSAARAIRDGVSVAILGRPNAGKSSLLNHLAGSDVAIVSATPGTTRDVIEVKLDLGGVPVRLADTAGIRDTSTDDIEIQGISRALDKVRDANIRVLVIDPLTDDEPSGELLAMLGPDDLLVWSKSDLIGDQKKSNKINDIKEFSLSATTGEGMEAFLRALTAVVGRLAHQTGDAALTRARHVEAVGIALDCLGRAKARIETAPELAAEDARLAARALGSITGAVDVEDVLGEIFSSFCIGK